MIKHVLTSSQLPGLTRPTKHVAPTGDVDIGSSGDFVSPRWAPLAIRQPVSRLDTIIR
jgi:hypothetical protein